MLLPPTNTPLTGIDFMRRLPCGENEKARKAMRVFFAIRKLSQQMLGEEEKDLPMTKTENSYKIGDVMDTGEERGREGKGEREEVWGGREEGWRGGFVNELSSFR